MMWGVGGGGGGLGKQVCQGRKEGQARQGVMGDKDKPNRGGKKGERVDKE